MEERKRIVVSASKIIKFSECPFRYKNEPHQQAGEFAKIGSAVHDSIAEIIRKNAPTGMKEIPELDISKVVSNALVSSCLTNDHYQEVMDLTMAGIEYFNRCVSMKGVLSIESDDCIHRKHDKSLFLVKLPVKMRDDSGKVVDVYIEGAMDLVSNRGEQDGIEVTDWKTGYNEENRIQADTYAVAAHLMYFNQVPVVLNFPFLRTESVSHYEYNSVEDIDIAMNFVESLVHKFINDKTFPKVYGIHCKNCTLATDCDAFKNNAWQSIEAEKMTPTELLQKYKEFIAAEKVFKDKKKVPYDMLIQVMGEQDVRNMSMGEAGSLVRYKTARTYKEDSDSLVALMLDQQFPIHKCVNFSFKKTKELLEGMLKCEEISKEGFNSIMNEISRFRFPRKSETIKIVSNKNKKESK